MDTQSHLKSLFPAPGRLQNEWVTLRMLEAGDFESLYEAASDPLIWEQHPNPDRYKRDVFTTYFEGAIQSRRAYLVNETKTGRVIGCTRYYDFQPEKASVCIGYTFVVRACWGKPYNRSMKTLMLDAAFERVNEVCFHIGAENIRSQKAIAKLGARKSGEIEMSYYGELPRLNFIYSILKEEWHAFSNQTQP